MTESDSDRQFTQGQHIIRRTQERSILGRAIRRPCDLTGTDEEPEDERDEHDRTTATCLVVVKTCMCGSEQCDAAADVSHTHQTSEQHKYASRARQTRDTADSETLS